MVLFAHILGKLLSFQLVSFEVRLWHFYVLFYFTINKLSLQLLLLFCLLLLLFIIKIECKLQNRQGRKNKTNTRDRLDDFMMKIILRL